MSSTEERVVNYKPVTKNYKLLKFHRKDKSIRLTTMSWFLVFGPVMIYVAIVIVIILIIKAVIILAASLS